MRARNVAFTARPAQGTAPSGVGVAVSPTTIGVRRTAVQSGHPHATQYATDLTAEPSGNLTSALSKVT